LQAHRSGKSSLEYGKLWYPPGVQRVLLLYFVCSRRAACSTRRRALELAGDLRLGEHLAVVLRLERVNRQGRARIDLQLVARGEHGEPVSVHAIGRAH